MWPYAAAAAALAGVAVVIRAWGIPYAEARLFKPEVTLTEVAVISPAQATVDLTGTGYVVPQVVAKVGAKVSGRVTRADLREGDSVKAGQVLFLLDPSDQRSAVASAQARAAAARAKAAAARARARVARANVDENKVQFERKKKLAASGAETKASADDLEARVKSLEEQVHASDAEAVAADADADSAHAEVNALAVTLGDMTIPAPISGTAVTKPAAVGDVVGPTSTLVELADFSTLLVEVDVPEARMGMIKRGGPCEVVLDAYPDKRLRGEVVEVSPRLNRAKATGTVKVRILDGEGDPHAAPDGGAAPAPVAPTGAGVQILPEMAARVSFLQKALDAAQMKEPPKKVIPAAAVAERAGGKVAFVVEDGKARMVPLVLGPPFAGGFELKDGPAPGARVVKAPPETRSARQAG